jgi:hypothetical protein
MNSQEKIARISARIRDHLIAQRTVSRAATPYGSRCAYRGDEGLSCAVGCLIADSFYNEGLEGLAFNAREVFHAVRKSLAAVGLGPLTPHEDYQLQDVLGGWQRYHDSGLYLDWVAGELEFGPAEFHLMALEGRWPTVQEIGRYGSTPL